ncbi:bifunctional class I SAM-dependent methyltransferase/NUDIX hydrolase [Streptomyces sp. NPDC053427]|uniref:bifunctional class I SAM-dependent methyltransferase/NUDIX hydrolase n=1 Tax=Streptomyces sp. NPDC053427 TaxID=3365701 RepID=UPI0037CDAA06
MGYVLREEWHHHYAEGRGFRPLGTAEKDLLAEHAAADGTSGQALDLCCGTGEQAAYLRQLGYRVDSVDFAESALARARAEHPDTDGMRWLCLDIEHDDLAPLSDDGYDLITLRLAYPFLHDRTRTLHALSQRLRPDGALVVTTPLAANTPSDRRDIALDEDEIGLLAEGWETVDRFDADGLALLVLRGPAHGFGAVEKEGKPSAHAVVGACVVVTDPSGRVLLGRSISGMWELPGGRVERGESFQAAAVRELTEETGLRCHVDGAALVAILHDERGALRRLSAVVRATAWSGEPTVTEPDHFTRWEWHDLNGLSALGRIFAPSAQALEAVWPGVLPGLPPVHSYPIDGQQLAVPG